MLEGLLAASTALLFISLKVYSKAAAYSGVQASPTTFLPEVTAVLIS